MDYALPTEVHLLFPNFWGWGFSQSAAAQPGRGRPSSLQKTSLKATRKKGFMIRNLTGSKLNSICKGLCICLLNMFLVRVKERSCYISVCVFCPGVHRSGCVQWVLSNGPFSVTFASSYRWMELIFQSLSTVDPFCLYRACWIVVDSVAQPVWHLRSDLNRRQSEIEFFLLNFPFLIFLQVSIVFKLCFYQVPYRAEHHMYVNCTLKTQTDEALYEKRLI